MSLTQIEAIAFEQCVPVVLITANVGSLFEDPDQLLPKWVDELVFEIACTTPKFLAIHLQEVGGKTYEKSMDQVQCFLKLLIGNANLQDFNAYHIFLDEDYTLQETFTALGNIYFIHKSISSDVMIWNFHTLQWENAVSQNIFNGNIETVPTKEKSKFPQNFFPECKWSRKGYMRTRWEIKGTVIDLVNIHLFHDASNLVACEEFPSIYSKTRRNALVYTLERFHSDPKNGLVPFFIFGDFNFRCDTKGVVQELTKNLTTHRIQSIKNDSFKMKYKNDEGSDVLTIGKKEFLHGCHQTIFKQLWLRQHDRELEPFRDILFEFCIEFPPSYPFEENPEYPSSYMSTRCPAWCDRILLSKQAKEIIWNESENYCTYSIIGGDVCMGDHKPVFLQFRLKPRQGIYDCCKCAFNNTNNSLSTPPITSVNSLPTKNSFSSCFYNNEVYNKNLMDAKASLESNTKCSKVKVKNSLNVQNPPSIRINVFDSDNSLFYVYTQVSENSSYLDKINEQENEFPVVFPGRISNGKRQAENVDEYHLGLENTHIKSCTEPYTPESTDSCSPAILNQNLSYTFNDPNEAMADLLNVNEDEKPPATKSFDVLDYKTNQTIEDRLKKQCTGVPPALLKKKLRKLQKSDNVVNIGGVERVESMQSYSKCLPDCTPFCCNIF